jgi:hypothetical protein
MTGLRSRRATLAVALMGLLGCAGPDRPSGGFLEGGSGECQTSDRSRLDLRF